VKTFDGQSAPDDDWYHVGYPRSDEQILADLKGPPENRRVPYIPDDPRATNQRPYIEFASKDRTPIYQQEEAR
jgi:hypothetical protein